MAENLKFLYFGNKKPDNEKGSQKEEEKNSAKQAEDAKKLAEDRDRLKAERMKIRKKILTKEAKNIYYENKSSITISKEAFIQKYIAKHMEGRSL